MPHQLVLDRYRILDQAGAGGFATVYAAWDTSLQRKVAIKELQISELDAYRATNATTAHTPEDVPPWEEDPTSGLDQLEYPADPTFLGGANAEGPAASLSIKLADVEQQRFFSHIPGLDEARAAAHLEDPNIVHVHDFQIVGTHAYIIMEYLDGLTLTQFLRDYDDELTLDIIAAVFADVAHALQTAHENNVLHLDIKPDNIIITRKGQVKVTDFGMAALSDLDGNAYTHGGTIGYMPLEQMRQESLDARCDEWALASVTYEMLNGENPFIAPDLPQAENAIETAELVLPSLMWNELDPEADDVLFCALDPDKQDRFANVAAFAREFQPLLGNPDVGQQALASLVGDGPSPDDEDDWEPKSPRIPLRERITPKTLNRAARVFGALASAATVALAFTNIGQFGDYGLHATLIAALVAAIIGAVRPHWGALCMGITWGAALLCNQLWILGAITLAATGGWWWFVGSHGKAAGNIMLAQPLASALGMPALCPLLAGYFLSPVKALACALYSVVLCFMMGSIGQGNLLSYNALRGSAFSDTISSQSDTAQQLITTPGTWAIAISWVLAALVLSLFCSRQKRLLAVIGAVAAWLLLLGGLSAAQLVNSAGLAFAPDVITALLMTLCGAVVIVACWTHVPHREDDQRHRHKPDVGAISAHPR